MPKILYVFMLALTFLGPHSVTAGKDSEGDVSEAADIGVTANPMGALGFKLIHGVATPYHATYRNSTGSITFLAVTHPDTIDHPTNQKLQ